MSKFRRFQRARRLIAVAVVVLWLVGITAASHSAASALAAITSQADLAVGLLRAQLGGHYETSDDLPVAAVLALSQSPLLMSARGAISDLRRSEEHEDDIAAPQPQSPSDTQSAPIPEDVKLPDTPLVIVDNGVSARTLVPMSPGGYIITGDVYIDNRSDRSFDESLFAAQSDFHLSAGGQPQVLIVHTHGSEAYTMPPGEEYVPSGDCRTTDENFSVVRVGEEIAAVLEAAGIRVLHDKTLHDYPSYSGAYNRSLTTVERYLERYPSIVMVLDVHRDAISDSAGNMYKVVSGIAGVNAAQMAFVIGTDGGGLSHPEWKENLKLAAAIQQTLCSDFPTLMRPITVRNSRYNQHTTTGSLLVEVGAAGNSLGEALLSARLLGDAIVSTLLCDNAPPIAESVIN